MAARLEKVWYERLFNSALFGRQRVITTPKLWDYDNLQKITKLEEQRPVFEKQAGWIRFFEPIISYFTFKWARDIQLQRGNQS